MNVWPGRQTHGRCQAGEIPEALLPGPEGGRGNRLRSYGGSRKGEEGGAQTKNCAEPRLGCRGDLHKMSRMALYLCPLVSQAVGLSRSLSSNRLSVCVCLSSVYVCLSVCLSICLSVFLSVSVRPSVKGSSFVSFFVFVPCHGFYFSISFSVSILVCVCIRDCHCDCLGEKVPRRPAVRTINGGQNELLSRTVIRAN